MPFCWICSFGSDYDSKSERGRKWRLQVRVPPGVPGEKAGAVIRFKVDLPSPDWYSRRVRSHNLDPNGGSAPKLTGQFRHRGATIIGLVRVAEGPYYEGPMTQFSAEAQLQWESYYEPLDAFVIQIEESWQLESPYHVENCAGKDNSNCSISLGLRQSFMPVNPPPPRTRLLGQQGRTEVARLPFGQALAQTPCLQVQSPIAELICKGSWRDLLWLARWTLPRELSWTFLV